MKEATAVQCARCPCTCTEEMSLAARSHTFAVPIVDLPPDSSLVCKCQSTPFPSSTHYRRRVIIGLPNRGGLSALPHIANGRDKGVPAHPSEHLIAPSTGCGRYGCPRAGRCTDERTEPRTAALGARETSFAVAGVKGLMTAPGSGLFSVCASRSGGRRLQLPGLALPHDTTAMPRSVL